MARRSKLIGFERGGPDWLWSRVAAEHEMEKKGLNVQNAFHYDIEVEDIRKFYRFWVDNSIEKIMKGLAFPDHYNATVTWLSNEPGSSKWYIEALILANSSNTDITKYLSNDETTVMVSLYRRMFFDTDSNLDNNQWMTQYIWEPASQSKDKLYFYNYIYKIVGYMGGPDILHTLMNPKLWDSSKIEWFMKIVRQEKYKFILNNTGNYATLPLEEGMIFSENSFNRWEDLRKESSKTNTSTLIEEHLTACLASSIGMIEPREGRALKRISNKEYIDVETYKDEDL